MKTAIFCTAQSERQAHHIIDQLRQAGFDDKDMSILYANKDDIISENTQRRAMQGAATGGLLGGAIGLLAGMGALAIPGLGIFLAAGPLAAALSGSAVGGGLGLLTGALMGMGIEGEEALAYEKRLQEGHILISAHVESEQELERVQQLLKQVGAQHISSSAEVGAAH